MLGIARVITHDMPFNYSELNNIGNKHSSGDFLLFLNDDTEVLNGSWLEEMLGYAQLPHVGAVGAKLLYPSLTVQHVGVLNLENGPGHTHLGLDYRSAGYYMRNLIEYNCLAVTGACLMIEKSKLDKVGGFDESLPIAYNDIELCFRLVQANFFNLVCIGSTLIHHESVSRGRDDITQEKISRLKNERKIIYNKHPVYFQYDPFFNKNFNQNSVHFNYD